MKKPPLLIVFLYGFLGLNLAPASTYGGSGKICSSVASKTLPDANSLYSCNYEHVNIVNV